MKNIDSLIEKKAKELINHRRKLFVIEWIEKFPFRIHTVRTDRGHEFQAKFHWHVDDKLPSFRCKCEKDKEES